MILHPYDLPRLRLVETPDPSDPTQISWSDFLAEPADPGQWTLACLLRLYVLSTCPMGGGSSDAVAAEGEYYRQGAIKLTWASPPKNNILLRSYREGLGSPEPGFVAVTDLPPNKTFEFIRSCGLDEAECFMWVIGGGGGADRLKEVLSILSKPSLIACSPAAKDFLETAGTTESAPQGRREHLGRVLRPFRCPGILETWLGMK